MYYYYSDATNNYEYWVQDDATLTKFKNEVLGSDYATYTGTSEYKALQAAAGYYNNLKNMTFTQGTGSTKNQGYYTKIKNGSTTYESGSATGDNLFKARSDASISMLTLPELNKALGRTDIDSTTSITDTTGLYQLSNVATGTGLTGKSYGSTYYLLASPAPSTSYNTRIAYVSSTGSISNTTAANYGVRPVVTLSSSIQLIKKVDGSTGLTYYEIVSDDMDTTPPTFTSYTATVDGVTITANATATDKKNDGTEGTIARIDYSIDGTTWQTSNTFTVSTAGPHTVYFRAIDAEDNFTVVSKEVTVAGYTVTYDANGGTGAPSIQYVIPGKSTTISMMEPTREGYAFLGWSENSTSTEATYTLNQTITPTGDIVLYAVWKKAKTLYYTYELLGSASVSYNNSGLQIATGTISSSTSSAVNIIIYDVPANVKFSGYSGGSGGGPNGSFSYTPYIQIIQNDVTTGFGGVTTVYTTTNTGNLQLTASYGSSGSSNSYGGAIYITEIYDDEYIYKLVYKETSGPKIVVFTTSSDDISYGQDSSCLKTEAMVNLHFCNYGGMTSMTIPKGYTIQYQCEGAIYANGDQGNSSISIVSVATGRSVRYISAKELEQTGVYSYTLTEDCTIETTCWGASGMVSVLDEELNRCLAIVQHE